MNITFRPTDTVSAHLTELSTITQRPIGDLINDLLAGPLAQMIGQQDTSFMQLVLEGVAYDDVEQAKVVVENVNALNRQIIRESGGFYVSTAYVDRDDYTIQFTDLVLLEA